MPIKESSDELNPAVVIPETEVEPRKRRTAGDYLALAIATCGVGYLPIAPGTFGSLVGVTLFYQLRALVFDFYQTRLWHRAGEDDAWRLFSESSFFTCMLLLVVISLSIIGIWAASRAELLFGRKDPKAVVIDEVVGQLITYVFVVDFIGPFGIAAGFVLFRAFDIIKPYPIRRLEGLHGGLGIVADDILAGLYAATALLIFSTLSHLRVTP